MHIYLGLCDVTQSKNGCPPLLLIIYFTNICNFLIFHSILIWFVADCMVELVLAFQIHLLSMLPSPLIIKSCN